MRRALLVGLVAVAAVVGLAGAPSARATEWVPPELPAAAADPWDAYTRPVGTTGAYSSSDMARILQERIWQTPSGPAGLSAGEVEFRATRLARFRSLLRLAPYARDVAPFIKFAGAGTGVLTVGLVTYEVLRQFSGQPDVSEWYTYDRAELGGAQVVVPSASAFTLGVDWRANAQMGWTYQTDCAPAVAATTPCWLFRYRLDEWLQSSPYGWQPYPAAEYDNNTSSSLRWAPAPDAGWCNSGNMSACIDPDLAIGTVKAGLNAAVSGAATTTVAQMDGVLSPLRIHGDLKANNSGHIDESDLCNRNATVMDCGFAYVNATAWERGAATITSTRPDGSDAPNSTVTYTVPSGAGNDADRAALDADDTECNRAIFNNLVDPAAYPYGGCDNKAADNETGTGVVVAPTPEEGTGTASTFVPFLLPQPLPSETYSQYLERLRDRGWLGTATLVNESSLEGTAAGGSAYQLAPVGAPTVLATGTATATLFTPEGARQPWTENPPAISTAEQPLTITKKPATTSLPPPDGGLDFSPITDIDWGCKIPFGLVTCYAIPFTELFNPSPDAPSWTFDFAGVAADAPGGPYDLGSGTVDLEVADDYMAIWRTLLSVCLWVGAVYWLAAKLLGFKTAGDPGEAVDDVL